LCAIASCTLVDHRFACGDVPLTLCQTRPPLAIANNAMNEQHHDERDDSELHRRACTSARQRSRCERRDRDCGDPEREPPWCRPHRQGVHAAKPRDAPADQVRRPPDGGQHDRDQSRADAHCRGKQAANSDRCGDDRAEHGGGNLLVGCAAAEPDLELDPDREHDRERRVQAQGIRPQAAE
jgi:hypothetical protein